MEYFINLVKSLDQYGHPISLNYNLKGDSYRTLLGGFTSIIVNVALGFYIVFKVQTMINYDDNSISYSELIRNEEQTIEEFKLSDIEATFFYAI